MPLWIALPGFFICACLGYITACLCIMSSKASRREEEVLEEARRVQLEKEADEEWDAGIFSK